MLEIVELAREASWKILKQALYKEFYAGEDATGLWNKLFQIRFGIAAYEEDNTITDNGCWRGLLNNPSRILQDQTTTISTTFTEIFCDLVATIELTSAVEDTGVAVDSDFATILQVNSVTPNINATS